MHYAYTVVCAIELSGIQQDGGTVPTKIRSSFFTTKTVLEVPTLKLPYGITSGLASI